MITETTTIDGIISDTVQQVVELEIKQLTEEIHTLLDTRSMYPEYMKLNEVCKYLNISINTLKKYVTEYNLAVIKIDGLKRISKSDLDKFMNSHKC